MPKKSRDKTASADLRAFKNALRGAINPQAVYQQLRAALPLKDIPQAVLWLRSTPYRGKDAHDREFPRDFGRMRRQWPSKPLALEAEFRWAAGTCVAFAEQLREFIKLSRSFSGSVLASSYSEASSTLAAIESRVGKCLWSIKANLFLIQLSAGHEALKRYTHEIIHSTDRNSLVPYITYFVSVRNEAAISTSSFKTLYDRHLSGLNGGTVLEAYLNHHIVANLPLSATQCAQVLGFESYGSVVDYYETAVELAAVLFRQSYDDYLNAISVPVQFMADAIADDRTALLLAALPDHAVPVDLVPLNTQVFDLFLAGDYENAIAAGKAALAHRPDSIELMEILARAAVLSDSTLDDAGAALGLVIADRMRRVIRRHAAWEDNLEYLSKLALNLHPLPPSHGLSAFCGRERQSAPRAEACHLTPPSTYPPAPYALHATAFPRHSFRAYLSAIEQTHPSALSTHFARAVLSVGHIPATLSAMDPRHEQLLRADRALHDHNYEAALTSADQLEQTQAPYYQHKAIRIRTKCLLRLNRLRECLSFATGTYLVYPNLHALLPLEELASRLDKPTRRLLQDDIAVPILFDMYSKHVASRYDEIRQFALEDFLEANGVDRPSRLRDRASGFDQTHLIYLLRYVAVPNVMDGSIAFDNTGALETERAAVCQWLGELDPDRREIYQAEIEDLTRRQLVRLGMLQLDRSKIHVNLDGIRSAISSRNLRESYNRYTAFESAIISEAAIQEVLDALNKYRSGEREIVLVVPLPKNEQTEILFQLLTDIRDEFVSNSEHGLNTYLSLNIRHGTLSGQLRGSLVAANLLTTREPDSTSYTPNTYWADRLVIPDQDVKSHISALLAKFSHDFDALVESIRSEWIQVRRRDEDKGLFDFRVLENDYRVIAASLERDTIFEQFIDLVLTRLMQRLEDQLAAVRQRFATDAKADFDAKLVELLTAVQGLNEYANLTEFENAIKAARTDLGHTINRIIDWFQLPKEESAKPFALSFALTIALESVKRMYGYDQLNATFKTEEDMMLPNLLLSRIVSLFGNVFDNTARHAHTPGPSVVTVRTANAGDAVLVVIENAVGPDVATEFNREKICKIQSDIRQGAYRNFVSREGGTGLHKIHKLLMRDLNSLGDLQFGFRDERTFFVEITLSKELRAL